MEKMMKKATRQKRHASFASTAALPQVFYKYIYVFIQIMNQTIMTKKKKSKIGAREHIYRKIHFESGYLFRGWLQPA